MLFSATTPNDKNIVNLNGLVLHSYRLLKPCVIEWSINLFFF